MQYLRLLLLPFSLIYGLIIWIRNKAYDVGLFTSQSFRIPVISIGNLAVGGSGKSPMAEQIIRLLKDNYKTAVLSRGYGRKSKGFRIVHETDPAVATGDEPLQFKRKFPDITVAVAEKRVEGISALNQSHDVIILDDAYQHRAVKPGLSLLLFDYTRLHEPFIVFPAGNFRESFSERKRADIIVVTKTPENLSKDERDRIRKRVKPLAHQQLFFSYLSYGKLEAVFGEEELSCPEPASTIFLLTGIANPYPLAQKLQENAAELIHHDYPDHHPFSNKNIAKLAEEFNKCEARKKLIITTEKDAQRLRSPGLKELLNGLPVYYLPVSATIHEPDRQKFDNLIKEYVTRDLQHH